MLTRTMVDGLSYLQTFDLCLLVLQLCLQLSDLGLLAANKRLFHHGLFLKLKLTLQYMELLE